MVCERWTEEPTGQGSTCNLRGQTPGLLPAINAEGFRGFLSATLLLTRIPVPRLASRPPGDSEGGARASSSELPQLPLSTRTTFGK